MKRTMHYLQILGLLAIITPGKAFLVPTTQIRDGIHPLNMSTSTDATSGAEKNRVKSTDFMVVDPL